MSARCGWDGLHRLFRWMLGICLFSSLGFAPFAEATDVQGRVFGQWTVDGSPYNIVGDAYVAAGETLRIDPGVSVYFASNCNLKVYGTLLAVGTASDSIVFSSPAATPGYWGSIYIDGASPAAQIRYATIRYASTGLTIVGCAPTIKHVSISSNLNGIDCLSGAVPEISFSTFRGNTNSALRSNGASPRLKGCIFTENALGGIESAVVLANSDSARVTQSQFHDNANAAIDLTASNGVLIANNTMVYNDYGLAVSGGTCEIANNIIVLNGVGIAADSADVQVRYNDVWNNVEADYLDLPPSIGNLTFVNDRGVPCDSFYNISADPMFSNLDSRDLRLTSGSPCIDSGDPTNPAPVEQIGQAPDMGAVEFTGALPVELAGFEYRPGELVWTTRSETNNWGFVVQSASAVDHKWRNIGFVPGHGTTTEPHLYRFPLPAPAREGAAYRLVQIDFDGTRHPSEPLVVTREHAPQEASLALYPNPANPDLQIRLSVPATVDDSAPVRVAVHNLRGQVVRVLNDGVLQPGNHVLRWDGRGPSGTALPSGVYLLVAQVSRQYLVRKFTLLR